MTSFTFLSYERRKVHFVEGALLSPPQTYLSFAYQKNVQDRTFTIQFLFHRFMEALP